MDRKKLAAFIMTGCLFTSVGCSSTGSSTGTSSGGGLFSGSCGHGSGGGLLSRMFGGGGNANTAATPVAYAGSMGGSMSGGMGGVDCPCSNQGGGEGMFHPAVMSGSITGGMPAMSGGGPVTGDMGGPQNFPMQNMPMQGAPMQGAPIQGGMIQGAPIQGGMIQGAPIQGMQPYPGQPGSISTPGIPPNMNQPGFPGQPPRIQPVPMAPSGVAPSSGMAPAAPWGPQ